MRGRRYVKMKLWIQWLKDSTKKHVLLKKHICKWQDQQTSIGKGLEVSTTSRQDNYYSVVTFGDRVANPQAMVLGAIAEHSLPPSMSPVLIDLAKELANDKKALNSLSIGRTSASYQMQYGLKQTMHDQTLSNLGKYPFSMDIDKAMSSNHKKVLAILVSYFDQSHSKVLIEHLSSIELIR